MMKSQRNICLITTFLLLVSLSAISQNKKELLNYADQSFKKENFVASTYFYNKVLGSYIDGERELVYPYEFIGWNKPVKVDDADTNSLDSNVSSEIEVAQTIDSNKSEETILPKTFKNENYRHALYYLAESYRLSYNYKKAEAIYQQCIELELKEYPFLHFWYALSLKKNMKYGAAQHEFNQYLIDTEDMPYTDKFGNDYYQRATDEIIGCKEAVDWLNTPVSGVAVKKMDSVFNGGQASFSASYYNEDASVLFASARLKSEGSSRGHDKMGSCDIYSFSLNEDSTWGNPSRISDLVNSIKHEGGVTISSDESMLFFTRWGETNGVMECFIYLSKKFNGRWLPPQKLNDQVNIVGYKSMHPYLTRDGTRLFYSSDRTGGNGKMDLWYCEVDELGNVSDASNIGSPVNTSEDEVSPMYLEDENTLYFSSNGHVGMGGLDIFEAYGNLNGFNRPSNLEFPINSSKDDKFFVLNKNVNKGFLSSDRADCSDCEGVNCLELYEVDYGPPLFTLSGHVYTKINKNPISNALISIRDVNANIDPIYIISDKDGYYFTSLKREIIYYLKAQKVKFFADADDVSTKGIDRTTHFERDFYLPRIPIGEIEIKGIEYDYDKWDLRPASKVTLDSLIIFLGVNNNLTIEISSHTDSRGQDKYNQVLSQKRAQSVVNYLVEKGIPKDRLTPVGYGEKKPIIKDAQTEEEHQRNRRTAFEVLRQDYVESKD